MSNKLVAIAVGVVFGVYTGGVLLLLGTPRLLVILATIIVIAIATAITLYHQAKVAS